MGCDPAAGALSAPSQTLDDRARLRRVDGGARNWRSGDALEIGRSKRDHLVHARRPFRARRLQRRSPQLPVVGRPAPPADPARRCTLARLGIAATRVPAPVLRARYARDRQAQDEMPDALRSSAAAYPSSSRGPSAHGLVPWGRRGPMVRPLRQLLATVSTLRPFRVRAAERWTPASAGVTIMLAIAVPFFDAVPIAAADTIYVSNEKDNTI